jgi:hypothetical protein
MTIALVTVKELHDRAMLLDRRHGSKMGRTCIPRNHALGHDQLMQDYFARYQHIHPASSVEGTECAATCL